MNIAIRKQHVRSDARSQILDLTTEVQKLISIEGVIDGFVIVFVPHTTAGVTINENADPDVKSDLLKKLEAMIPKRESYYEHGEGNSDSHLKTALVGNSATILIERGKLVLGTWQGIYFCEFDGPRERQYLVKLVSLDRTRDS